jgi:hypothetical protein
MNWIVNFHEAFETEFADFSDSVKIEIMAHVRLLQTFGPQLNRPHADTLEGSKHANMKELRFKADNGVSHLLLIQNVQPFYWLPGIKAE